jgi:hypothetical protein
LSIAEKMRAERRRRVLGEIGATGKNAPARWLKRNWSCWDDELRGQDVIRLENAVNLYWFLDEKRPVG